MQYQFLGITRIIKEEIKIMINNTDKTPKNKPAKLKAIHRYDAKTYKIISFRIKRGDTEDILSKASNQLGISKNEYIKQALNDRLIKDGFKPLK